MKEIKLNAHEIEVLGMIACRKIEQPISSTEIRHITGRESADTRTVVNKLRNCGITVLSNQYGYYMASDKSELVVYLRSFEARVNEMLKVYKALQGTADDVHAWKNMIKLDFSKKTKHKQLNLLEEKDGEQYAI